MDKTQIVKKANRLFLSLLMLFAVTAFTQAQQTISGTVTDAKEGNTLVGATVQIKGTTRGTITDVDGQYSIEADKDETLVFSYIGYVKQEVSVGNKTTINVALQPKTQTLGEVVVVGYGTEKKEDATGSVSAIESEDFNKGSVTSPQELLTGKISGVQITDNGGAPGEGATIRIRGGSSLSASNDPLIVVDGVPLDNTGIAGARNGLNAINPNDIESFTVLKDASATAIYGSRASNGVIMITTKQGEAGQPLEVNYSYKLNYHTPTGSVDVLGADKFRELVNQRYPNQTDMLGNASTDWQERIYKNAMGMDNNLSISGSVNEIPFRASFGYTNNDGILKRDNNTRKTAAITLNPSFFDDHLKLTANAKGIHINNRFADRGAIGAAMQFDPTQPVYNSQQYSVPLGDEQMTTNWGGYNAWLQESGLPVDLGTANPMALLYQRNDVSTVNRFNGKFKADYKFHFFPDLKATLNMGYDYSKGEGNVYVPQTAAFAHDPIHGGGTDNSYENENKNELLDFYLTYKSDFENIDSRVKFMTGYSWQHFYNDSYSINSNVARTPNQTDTISDPRELYLISFFGRLNYTFKNKYLLTFTLRNDGTSRFSPDTRWGLFPSAALGWKIQEEGFLQDVDFISQMKLRLGWGVTGQQDVGGYYEHLPRYTYSLSGASYMFGNTFYQTIRPEGYDENIKWEETTTYNIGLDFGFMKDRYYGSLEFYLRDTKDLLNYIPVPAGSNVTNYINTNIGDLENRGFEFSFNAKPIVRENLKWQVGMNVTYNENEITKLTASDDPTYLGVRTGGISGGVGNNIQIHSVGHSTNSFFLYEQVYDENGDPIPGVFVDQNDDGQITDADRVHNENPDPEVSLGINSSLTYKNWYFSFSGRTNIGSFVYYNVASENGVYNRLYRPEGPYLSNISTTVFESGFESPHYLSDYYLRDGSFFRMDNISLSYTFKDVVNEGSSLQLSATVNNAFVITKYDGLDPELVSGIDNRVYPRPRTYVLGVNLSF
ncbi:MAG: TonB-dependent receptor [Bacteroidales bacterium]|nr:TonB-dependent receptor [Bacteroidales bacterium]